MLIGKQEADRDLVWGSRTTCPPPPVHHSFNVPLIYRHVLPKPHPLLNFLTHRRTLIWPRRTSGPIGPTLSMYSQRGCCPDLNSSALRRRGALIEWILRFNRTGLAGLCGERLLISLPFTADSKGRSGWMSGCHRC
jgi:hypothetical protein